MLKDFKDGATRTLVATNVMARGIDVKDISLVVNYTLPRVGGGRVDANMYIHRIGRTGRWGKRGAAITFVRHPSETALPYVETMDARMGIPRHSPGDLLPGSQVQGGASAAAASRHRNAAVITAPVRHHAQRPRTSLGTGMGGRW